MLLFSKENKILRTRFLENVTWSKSEWWGRSFNQFSLNNEGKDTKQKNYYNSWSKIKHLLVAYIWIFELGQFKLLEDQLHLRFIRSSTAERKEQLHDKNE